MPHPLVTQLRFARRELQRGLAGLADADARRRLLPMNAISWNIGHLAWHEQRSWLQRAQGRSLVPALDELVGWGRPASTPPLAEMWAAWETITTASDPYLDTLTTAALQTHFNVNGQPYPESVGTVLRRVTYHYWYHIGESLAVRQLLGHQDLPDFVGDLPAYQPED